MIDTRGQATCRACGKPLAQKGGKGHRPRLYCDDACKQVFFRRTHRTVNSHVTNEQDYQSRIAALEEEVATLKTQLSKRTRTSGKVRANLQRRLLVTGKTSGYPAVTIRVPVGQGVDAWRAFAKDASEDLLARAIVAAGGS